MSYIQFKLGPLLSASLVKETLAAKLLETLAARHPGLSCSGYCSCASSVKSENIKTLFPILLKVSYGRCLH